MISTERVESEKFRLDDQQLFKRLKNIRSAEMLIRLPAKVRIRKSIKNY